MSGHLSSLGIQFQGCSLQMGFSSDLIEEVVSGHAANRGNQDYGTKTRIELTANAHSLEHPGLPGQAQHDQNDNTDTGDFPEYAQAIGFCRDTGVVHIDLTMTGVVQAPQPGRIDQRDLLCMDRYGCMLRPGSMACTMTAGSGMIGRCFCAVGGSPMSGRYRSV